MACSDYNETLALLALDALGSPEREALEAHLTECPACREELQRLQEAAELLAYAAPPAPLPAGLKQRVMARVEHPEPVALPARRQSLSAWKAACAALALGLLAAIAWGATAQSRLFATEARMARLEEQLVARAEQLELLKARDVQMAALESQAPAPDAVARFIWSPERRAWLVAISGLAPAEAGKTYQLWAVTPDAKHSLGTFQTDEQGEVILEGDIRVPPSSVAAAVSIEPSGGVPQPTGPIVMVGALAR